MKRYAWTMTTLAAVAALSAQASAAVYHVAPGGSDEGDGSTEKPFSAVGKVGGMLRPGDAVVISGGEFSGGFTLSGLKGAEGRPILLRADDGARVVFRGSSGSGQSVRLIACEHVVLRGLEVADVAEGPGVLLQNCRHCVVEGNVVHDCRRIGIQLAGGAENGVRGNICYHNDSGIYVGLGATRNLIEANVCAFGNQSSENADGIGSSDCLENTYRFNVLVANNDDGLDMWTSKQCVIEWNFACANGDQREGDGNGFKLGGKWGNRPADDPWNGGEHQVRHNLSCWNLSTGFTDNGSSGNRYEENVSFGNRHTGDYASVKHTPAGGAERIRTKIRERFAALVAEGVIRPDVHPLPVGVGLVRELKVWPEGR